MRARAPLFSEKYAEKRVDAPFKSISGGGFHEFAASRLDRSAALLRMREGAVGGAEWQLLLSEIRRSEGTKLKGKERWGGSNEGRSSSCDEAKGFFSVGVIVKTSLLSERTLVAVAFHYSIVCSLLLNVNKSTFVRNSQKIRTVAPEGVLSICEEELCDVFRSLIKKVCEVPTREFSI